MFQLLFTEINHRSWYGNKEVSWRNKFDLQYIRSCIGNRFNIYDGRDDVESITALCDANVEHKLPRKCFVFEVQDEDDMVWAKLSHSSILKNTEKYQLRYAGQIGPFSHDDLNEVRRLTDELSTLKNLSMYYSSDMFALSHVSVTRMHGCLFGTRIENLNNQLSNNPAHKLLSPIVEKISKHRKTLEGLEAEINAIVLDMSNMQEESENIIDSQILEINKKIIDLMKLEISE